MTKQSITKILFTILISMMGSNAFAHDIEVKNADGKYIYYNWNENKTELIVSYRGSRAGEYSDEYFDNIVIPESVEYNGSTYGVTAIGNVAFNGCSGLTSVTIPNSVTSIGSSAFYGCSGLTSVTIPNSVTSIGSSAFYLCKGLSSVTLPSSLNFIGEDAFYDGSKHLGVTISVTDLSTFCNNIIIENIKRYTSLPIKLIDTIGNEIIEFIIPEGVTSIGSFAFYNCTGLTSIIIPNSITFIGDYAFQKCSGIISLIIPSNVTSIGEYAFEECSGLTSVSYLCNSAFHINAFSKCYNIKEITFDCEKVCAIFNNKTSITNITMTDKVTSIGNSAFSGCSGLTSITIPNSVTSIEDYAFSGCTGLTYISIPNSVTSIGKYAFHNCKELISLTIPNSVTSIEKETFAGCYSLTSIVIGSGVNSIGNNAFYNTNLKKTIWLTNTPPAGYNNVKSAVNYVSNEQYTISNKVVYPFLSSYFDVDGICYVPVSPSERTCDAIDCLYDKSAESINIAKTVTNKSITLTVKKINPYTCYSNNYIKDVNLSLDGDIGEYAFYECQSIEKGSISNQGNIEEYAFSGCSALTTATISNNGYVGDCAFTNCRALISAKIKNRGSIGNQAFYNCNSLETAELGEDVTSIGSETFKDCSKLQSIVIPNAVTSMGSYAFSDCSGLTSAKIGNGLGVINEYTFSNCSSLKELTIGSQVTTINQYALNNCSSLPTITIPQAVTEIGNNVFYGCSELKKVIMSDSERNLKLGSNGSNPLFYSCPLDSVYIGRDISYNTSSNYGYSPFYRNTLLRAVKITDRETEISENEFYGCTNLQRVIIGDGVKTIGDWAFSGCSSLKFFAFGTHMKDIGQEAFSDCTAVVEIYSKSATPPTCGTQALDDINKWECKLLVPDGCLATYQAADQWKEFFFVEENGVVPEKEGDANGDSTVNAADIVEIVNYIMGNPSDGFNEKAIDVNGDGVVNIADIIQIVNNIIGK